MSKQTVIPSVIFENDPLKLEIQIKQLNSNSCKKATKQLTNYVNIYLFCDNGNERKSINVWFVKLKEY